MMNPLATAATPRQCGAPGGVLSMVPYVDGQGIPKTQFQQVCIRHAAECATWNFTHRRQMPLFTEFEIDSMVSLGANRERLIAELSALGLYTPCTTPNPDKQSP
jgi:hypothetical protein